MEFMFTDRVPAGLSALHARIRRLPARLRIATPSSQAVLAGALACGFAWVANERSTRAGREAWLQSHLPSTALLDGVMAARGLQLLNDPALVDRWWRNLPVTVAAGPEGWRHAVSAVVVFYLPDGDTGLFVPRIYAGAGLKRIERSWEPLGLGWDALDRYLRRQPVTALPFSVANATFSSSRDPRQLKY